MFWKVVPSGEGTGRQHRSPANVTTVESRESTWGSRVHLPYAALTARMVSFAEPSFLAATAVVRNWLCPSHTCVLPCPASPGPGERAGRAGARMSSLYVPSQNVSSCMAGVTPYHPSGFKAACLSSNGVVCVCVNMRLGPVPICVPQSPQDQALTQEMAVDPGALLPSLFWI